METIKRREGLALSILVALTLSVTLSPIGPSVNAQETVFVVSGQRKSDRVEIKGAEKRKAEALARILRDAGIDVIYTIGRSLAAQTAGPTAKTLNLRVNNLPRNHAAIDDLIRRLPTEHAGKRVLIITVGPGPMPGEGLPLLKGLGVSDQDIWSRRSDHLMVIIPDEGKEPLVIKMRW